MNRLVSLAVLALSAPAFASDSLWIRGDTYKASFGAEGATYIPFLGSRAPRNHPVHLRVDRLAVGGAALGFDRAASPIEGKERFDFDRGAFVESYLVLPDGLEQTFRFDRLEGRGDLELAISVESDLVASESASSIELATDGGAVRFGKATVVDAGGRRLPVPTALVEGGIRIVVPAEFLASARFPVTVDPVISTFTIDGSTADDAKPDVAYDASNDRYLAVYQEAFSATDHDVRVKLLNSTGGVITSGFVDNTSADWITPRVANHNGSNQFLVVAQETSGLDVIGKTVSASTLAMSGVITIGHGYSEDVGGTSSTSSTADYLVVWTDTIEGLGQVVEQRLVGTNGVPAGAGATFTSIGTTGAPRVSKSNRGFDWNVVYMKNALVGTRIHSDGSVTTPEFVISSASNIGRYSASSCLDSTSRYLVAFAQQTGVNRDIEVAFLDDGTVLDTTDLSTLEGDSPLGDQFDPSTDTDGGSFAVAYTEFIGFPTANDSTYVSTLTPVGTQLHVSEGHRTLSAATVDEDDTSITGTKGTGGGAGRFMAVWDVANGSTNHGDIEGGLLDAEEFTTFCSPGVDGVAACPCSNPPSSVGEGCNNSAGTGGARLAKSGTASLANDTLVFTTTGERATAFTVLFQGTAALQNGAINGQGVRCVGGTLKRLYKKNASGGSITAPSGSDASVSARAAAVGAAIPSGATRYYYVSYRDPVVLGSCPAASTFNLSQAGAVIWRP